MKLIFSFQGVLAAVMNTFTFIKVMVHILSIWVEYCAFAHLSNDKFICKWHLRETGTLGRRTCTSSSSAYLSRLSSHSAPSRSSRSLWASVLAPVISSRIFCSRFCFSTATVRFSSWAFSSLGDRRDAEYNVRHGVSFTSHQKPDAFPSLTGSAGLRGSAQHVAGSPDPSSSERYAPCWTYSARMQTSSPQHRSLWRSSGRSLSSSYVVDLQREDQEKMGLMFLWLQKLRVTNMLGPSIRCILTERRPKQHRI